MKPAADPAPSGADALVAAIAESAAAEAAQTLAEARERAQRLAAAARAEADAIREAARDEGEERGRRRAAEVLALAETDVQREWLRAREALIEAALDRARAQLAAFPALPGAARILVGLIEEALGALPEGPVRLLLPAGYETLVDDTVRARLGALRPAGVRLESAAVPAGGVIAEAEDGRVRFDNSLDARMGRLLDPLRRLVAEILLGEEPPARAPA